MLLKRIHQAAPRGKLVLGDLYWTNYSRQVPLCNAEPKFVTVTADNDFLFDADALEAAITPKAFDKRVGPAVAKAVAEAARRTGVARI